LATEDTPLKTALYKRLAASGRITFEQYMDLCLYHPEYGYYMRGAGRTGKQGDYFTSSDLHPIFARLIARQAAEMWATLGRPACFTWVEMGAGRGLFAGDFLDWARKTLPDFCQALRYVAIEPGIHQRDCLMEALKRRLPFEYLRDRVCITQDIGSLAPVTGCFFSNELVDAFPVHVVTRANGRLKELYVAQEKNELQEVFGPLSSPGIATYVARYANQVEEGQRTEVSLRAAEWMHSVAEKLAKGFVLTIDYGDLAERLYSSERRAGTLTAYRRHTVSESFYDAPGEQDLTAHVNFSALIDAGNSAGLELAGYTTQERFLIALGETNEFADLYQGSHNEAEKLQARMQLKRLIFPGGMGNVFKVLIQHRGVPAPRLTGLKYARAPSRGSPP
jgi:SAM-dependent MidA family methyltransferase